VGNINNKIRAIRLIKAAWGDEDRESMARLRCALRELAGISQADMAKTLGVGWPCISLTMKGLKKNPRLQDGIAAILQAPKEEIF
jgi:DNA-binding XRE family transcriptional regulator